MFSAQRVGAQDAYRMGFAQQMVPAADLEQVVTDYANVIAGNAPMTVATMKFISTQVLADPGERDLAKLCTKIRVNSAIM